MSSRKIATAGLIALGVGLVPALALRAQQAGETLTDQQFVSRAASSGQAEVMLGKAALQRATSDEVKAFARKMVEDHGKANRELLQLAGTKKIAVSKQIDPKQQVQLDRLELLQGEAFDRAYAQNQVQAHREAVQLFEAGSRSARDKDLKAFANRTLPTLREHLKMARELPGGKDEPESSGRREPAPGEARPK